MGEKHILFDAAKLRRFITAMAREIAADFAADAGNVFLVGIHKQGVPLAERLAAEIGKQAKINFTVGKLDISMYRDDVGLRSGLPLIQETVIPFAMENAKVILVDDVLSSGRTIRAALDALTDYGRPAMIKLAVMADRGSAEFPIRADYVGVACRNLPPDRKILVEFAETDGADGIFEMEWKRE